MSKIPLITKIEILCRGKYPHWVHSGEVEIFSQNEGYKASHGDRRARDLVAEGKLERVRDGVSVKYRWNPNHSPPEEKENMYKFPRKKIPKRFYDPQIVQKINQTPAFKVEKQQSLFA